MTATLLSFPAPVSGDASALDPDSKVTRERAADWAYERLWGTTAPLRFDPEQANRRMAAVGYSDFYGVMVSTGPHPQATRGERGYAYFPHYGYGN